LRPRSLPREDRPRSKETAAAQSRPSDEMDSARTLGIDASLSNTTRPLRSFQINQTTSKTNVSKAFLLSFGRRLREVVQVTNPSPTAFRVSDCETRNTQGSQPNLSAIRARREEVISSLGFLIAQSTLIALL